MKHAMVVNNQTSHSADRQTDRQNAQSMYIRRQVNWQHSGT